jgi:hypothetical protein
MARAMTRREVIEKYVRFEQTPWGTSAATPESMERTLRRCSSLPERGCSSRTTVLLTALTKSLLRRTQIRADKFADAETPKSSCLDLAPQSLIKVFSGAAPPGPCLPRETTPFGSPRG